MSGFQRIFLLGVAFILIQEAVSLKCYESTGNSKGSEITCPTAIANMCVKMNFNGQITRSCDGGFCTLFNNGNKGCKNFDTCNLNITSAFKENSNSISNLIHPQRLDTQCNICCCNSDGCNFAIGTKAFMTLIFSSLSFLFLVKH